MASNVLPGTAHSKWYSHGGLTPKWLFVDGPSVQAKTARRSEPQGQVAANLFKRASMTGSNESRTRSGQGGVPFDDQVDQLVKIAAGRLRLDSDK